MRNVTHSDKLGRVAEDLAIIKLSTLFEDCIVSKVENNQLHDIEIRKKEEPLTENICKIQVKSTTSKRVLGSYQNYLVIMHHGARVGKKAGYNKGDVDFFFIYVFPEAKFYIIPADALRGKTGASLFIGLPMPKQRGSAIYEKYLEAWELIADFLGLSTKEGDTIDNTLAKFM